MEKIKEHYANALLEFSKKNGTLEQDLEQGIVVRDAINNPDVKLFLEHDYISKEEKQKLFQEAFSDNLSEHMKGFMDLMLDNKKESLILPVLDEYINSINKSMGRMEAVVVSAKALSEQQIESIRLVLSKQSNMNVDLIMKVDPDVIGGFYILIDGHLFDGTIRTELKNMKESLKKGSHNGI